MKLCLYFLLLCIITFETSNAIEINRCMQTEDVLKYVDPYFALQILKSTFNHNSDLHVIRRKKFQAGRYVGCYQDHNDRRMLTGYVTRSNSNTKEKCVGICQSGGFVYAATTE